MYFKIASYCYGVGSVIKIKTKNKQMDTRIYLIDEFFETYNILGYII